MSDQEDYAHLRDPQAQRTRYELWAIVIIVVLVVVGGVIWRAVAHKPAGPQQGYGPSTPYPSASPAGAAAGVHSTSPLPRPAAP